ncbi:MAG: hypothetical protein AAFX65_14145, partial [Cyanobacteria bacterium J06638_7]
MSSFFPPEISDIMRSSYHLQQQQHHQQQQSSGRNPCTTCYFCTPPTSDIQSSLWRSNLHCILVEGFKFPDDIQENIMRAMRQTMEEARKDFIRRQALELQQQQHQQQQQQPTEPSQPSQPSQPYSQQSQPQQYMSQRPYLPPTFAQPAYVPGPPGSYPPPSGTVSSYSALQQAQQPYHQSPSSQMSTQQILGMLQSPTKTH